jgi:hypothetical protein
MVADGMGLFIPIAHVQKGRTRMDTTPLCVFATKARASNRLLYGDLRRLRRDVLPRGVKSREEVETLLSLDRIERVDRDWPRYLAITVSEFVLSTADPPGVIDGDTAAWLAAALAETRPKTAAVVLRSIMGEAHQVDEALVAFVRRDRPPRRRPTPDVCLRSRSSDFSHDALPERRENDPIPTREVEEPRPNAPVDLVRHWGAVDTPGPLVAPFAIPDPQCFPIPRKQDQAPAHRACELHANLALIDDRPHRRGRTDWSFADTYAGEGAGISGALAVQTTRAATRVKALPPTGAHTSAIDHPKGEKAVSVVSAPKRDAKI